MSNTIQKNILIAQPRERVWSAIATSAGLAGWMFPNDFAPQVGHQFTFQVPPDPTKNFDGLTVASEVLVCDPPSCLAFTWSAAGLSGTQVSFRLEPEDEGTRLYLEHSGFNFEQPWGKQAFRGAQFGWDKMLGQLPAVVSRLE